eukprot:CAMPEP_0119070182 /NCGR_PEP_ID=MMETSP1178-20130426/36125_1 /TAXON_ID=33656 /ORGANISM="unid sp, Strain CCMP2000" /LENGTH=140 /DNA_ID=CAMNT_0007051995 /DNA_START=51 /DNA_END=473 /DNA_ORIENTATION=+
MRRVCLLALCLAVCAELDGLDLGTPLVTIPLHKGGEEYALLDFFSSDPAHIEQTAHAFCFDHKFTAGDKKMIIEHATREIAKVQSQMAQTDQLPKPPEVPPSRLPKSPESPPSNGQKLVQFMTANKMSVSDVLHALADTL